MTCIVALRDKKGAITMGADSFVGSYYSKRTKTDSKIFKLENMLIGYCGYPLHGDLIKYNLSFASKVDNTEDPQKFLMSEFIPSIREMFRQNGALRVENEEQEMEGSKLLVALNKKIFYIEGNFQVVEHDDDFDAVGSGQDYALASMYSYKGKNAKDCLTKALECASYFCTTVSGPFQFETLSPNA